MKQLDNQTLKTIQGGAFSAALLTAIIRGFNSILDLGRSLGSAIRRIQFGKMCSL